MLGAKLLEGRVDRRAARPGVDRLVGPVQREELEDVARPDRIGVAGQGLDAGDGQLARPIGHAAGSGAGRVAGA